MKRRAVAESRVSRSGMTRRRWMIVLGGAAVAGLLPLFEFHVLVDLLSFRTGWLIPYIFSVYLMKMCGIPNAVDAMAVTCIIYAVHVGVTLRIWFASRKLGLIFAALLVAVYAFWVVMAQGVKLG